MSTAFFIFRFLMSAPSEASLSVALQSNEYPIKAMYSMISDLSAAIFPHSYWFSLIRVLIIVLAVYAVNFGALHFVDFFTLCAQAG
ncbi:unnamed protein product [Protopolystoma xenopodis]|uniref:Ion transport domain-containing protein n=1 Tax=Protopolystoma xenopodis TaxID=117903 RepID=A0A3S5A0H9_9PLAT|nr:unnamed protein product [Protopolystoma xenopodis]